jgi:hypothetical protein
LDGLNKNLKRKAIIGIGRYNISEIIASTMKIITSHLAISIDTPATPRAPNIAAIIASTKKIMARLIKLAILCHPFIDNIIVDANSLLIKLFIVFLVRLNI